jgi:invasion protein IalB
MINFRQSGAVALLLMTVCAQSAVAQGTEPESLGEFNDWAAYSYKAADTKVCYVSSRPKGSEPKNVKRDPAFFLVTHMPGRKVKGEVSTIIGYPFKKETNAELTIDEAKFTLFTNADGAWADTPATEKQIVAAMKSGKSLKVKGTSWRGTQTEDTYSLDGISAALAAIDKACK